MIKMLQYKMYPAGELRCPTTALVSAKILLACMPYAIAKAAHIFFSKNISIYAILNGQSFNDMLTNDS